jgi:hypothetical protein
MMRIRLEPDVALKLETITVQARGQEFSGFGFVNVDREHNEFVIYDIVLLDIGSEVFTEIPREKLLALMDHPDHAKLKCWLHRHPVGDGRPGPHNWSGTDNNTARNTPLGGIPELVGWSISIVRTPLGWVGRYDTYGAKGNTWHLEVTPNFGLAFAQELAAIQSAKPSASRSGWWGNTYSEGENEEADESDPFFFLTAEEQDEVIGMSDEEFEASDYYQDERGFIRRRRSAQQYGLWDEPDWQIPRQGSFAQRPGGVLEYSPRKGPPPYDTSLHRQGAEQDECSGWPWPNIPIISWFRRHHGD